MKIRKSNMISLAEANQYFNKVSGIAKKFGDAVILKENIPAYILFDIEVMGEDFLNEYKKLRMKHISESLVDEYVESYKALAK